MISLRGTSQGIRSLALSVQLKGKADFSQYRLVELLVPSGVRLVVEYEAWRRTRIDREIEQTDLHKVTRMVLLRRGVSYRHCEKIWDSFLRTHVVIWYLLGNENGRGVPS